MTDADDMIGHLTREPECEIVRAMLTDELMESRGMLRTEADRHVARLCCDARDALDIAWVAKLIRARGPAFHALRAEVERVCAMSDGDAYTMYIIAGTGLPTGGVYLSGLGQQGIGSGLAIALPASWVRRWHAGTRHTIRRRRGRKRGAGAQ